MRKRTWKKQDKLIKIAIIMFAVCIFMTTGYGLFHDGHVINGLATVRPSEPGHDPDENIDGEEMKEKMVALASTMGFQNINAFLHSSTRPTNFSEIVNDPAHIISGPNASHPCYIWLSGNSIYWWSEGTPKMPQDASSMFEGCYNLNNVQGLADFDWTPCHDISNMFNGCMNISDLSCLQNVNVSNITNMSGTFSGCQNLRNIAPLANWNVSNVTDMSSMFENVKMQNLNALSSWNVSNVNNFSRMFYNCQTISNPSGVHGWNINREANFYQMFYGVQRRPTFTNVPGSFNYEGTFIPAVGRSLQVQEPIEEINHDLEELDSNDEENDENVISNEIIEDNTNTIIENEVVDNTIKDDVEGDSNENLITIEENIEEEPKEETKEIFEDN